jgi:replicative superfamily II helicase
MLIIVLKFNSRNINGIWITDILMQHSRGKSALIFCSTRKGAQEAAQCLSQTGASLGYSNPFMKSMQQYEHLKAASLTCSDKQLQACIIHGGYLESCSLGTHNTFLNFASSIFSVMSSFF